MRRIKKMVDMINDELCGADEYSDLYLEAKIDGNSNAAKYKEMANDEIKRSTYLHEMAMHEIEKSKKVIQPPQSMVDKWSDQHTKYTDKIQEIKNKLSV